MKQLFGFLMMGLLVSVVGCATNVEKGDELSQQGKYQEAIKLYEQVKSDDEEYGKAQEGIANCNFQLGEIEFNAKNWEDAIALYKKANTPEARERISSCNFQLGEIEFSAKNWKKAIGFYAQTDNPKAKERIAACNLALGKNLLAKKRWQEAKSSFLKIPQDHAGFDAAKKGIQVAESGIRESRILKMNLEWLRGDPDGGYESERDSRGRFVDIGLMTTMGGEQLFWACYRPNRWHERISKAEWPMPDPGCGGGQAGKWRENFEKGLIYLQTYDDDSGKKLKGYGEMRMLEDGGFEISWNNVELFNDYKSLGAFRDLKLNRVK